MAESPLSLKDLKSLYGVYQLYSKWGQLSPAQKSRAVASLGIQGFSMASGKDLASSWIVKPDASNGFKGVNIGQAFDLFSKGYNAYSLAKNWNQLNTIQRVVGGGQGALNIAQTAKNFGLLGQGSSGAAVAISPDKLAAFTPAPNFGVGALTAPAGTAVPSGYTAVASGAEGVVAVPSATATSASGSIGIQPPTLGQAGGALAMAAGAYQVMQGWGTGGKEGAINGAIGGSMMAGGLYAMGAWNPYVAGGLLAVSVLGNMAKTGKSESQKARDQALGFYKQNGYVGENNTITLSDGTIVDLGIDGHGGKHKVRNAQLLTEQHRNEGREQGDGLNYWDVDYTNDLDYFAGTAANSLARITAGGKSKAIDQFSGKLGNAMLANIGYGQDMTPENFGKLQQNLRGVFSQWGISSKQDAYQLANQMYGTHRIDDIDLVSMHQMFNVVFDDNGYDTAQKLISGRHKGIEVAFQDAHLPESPTVEIGQNAPLDFGDSGTNIDPGRFPGSKVQPPTSNNNVTGAPFGKPVMLNPAPASKEEARMRNKAMYSSPVSGQGVRDAIAQGIGG